MYQGHVMLGKFFVHSLLGEDKGFRCLFTVHEVLRVFVVGGPLDFSYMVSTVSSLHLNLIRTKHWRTSNVRSPPLVVHLLIVIVVRLLCGLCSTCFTVISCSYLN